MLIFCGCGIKGFKNNCLIYPSLITVIYVCPYLLY